MAPEIGILFGDAVGASLVRGPWLPAVAMSCVTLLYVAGFEQHDSTVFEWGVKQAPREAPDALRKQMHFKRGPKVDPLRIESGPFWRVCFWCLYFIRYLKLCRLRCAQNLKLEAILTQTAMNWGGPYLRL